MALSSIELAQFIEEKGINDKKISVQNLINIYKDDWRYIIILELAQQFTQLSQDKLRPLITQEMNIIKRVTNETSLVYKNPAKRKALIPQETEEEIDGVKTKTTTFIEDANYESVMAKTTINSTMKQVNRYTTLTNQTLLKVVWRDKKIDYDMLTFDNAEIFTEEDDWKKIIAVKYFIDLQLPIDRDERDNVTSIQNQDTAEFSTMFLWTLEDRDETSGIYKKSFVRKMRNIEGEMVELSKEENPYKDEDGNFVLPFVFIPNKTPHENLLDFTTGNDVLDGNINIALNYIHINNIIKYQSYILMYIKANDKSAFPDSWDLDMSSILTLLDTDGNAEVGSVDLQAKIKDLWSVIFERIILILGSRNIPPSAVRISGSPESGIKIRLDKNALLENREDDIELYRDSERKIFELTRIVNNHHDFNNQISEEAELNIDFGEIDFPTTRQEDAAADHMEIQDNTLTPWEVLQRKNPDLTDDEAKEKFEANKAFNTVAVGGLSEIEQPDNTLDQ